LSDFQADVTFSIKLESNLHRNYQGDDPMSRAIASKSYRAKPAPSKNFPRSKIWLYFNIALAVSLMAVGVFGWVGSQQPNNRPPMRASSGQDSPPPILVCLRSTAKPFD
jgi:hypothetical protein